MRLKLVPDQTSYDFFRYWSHLQGLDPGDDPVVGAVLCAGPNRGSTSWAAPRSGRTTRPWMWVPTARRSRRLGWAMWRSRKCSITFGPEQNVASIRIQAEGRRIRQSRGDCRSGRGAFDADPNMGAVPSVESVGPEVSAELMTSALTAVGLAILAVLAMSGPVSNGSSRWRQSLRWSMTWS